MHLKHLTRTSTAVVASAALLFSAVACTTDDEAPSAAASPALPEGEENPMIAEGVTIDSDASLYKTSGLGPENPNPDAEDGSPESFIDIGEFPDAELPDGVSVTEAQGINVLMNIKDNLEAQGLQLSDVISMRVFVAAEPGEDVADFAGWNRAYRQFFANTNLDTDETELVEMGDAEPAAPIERNPARPSRYMIEVANLPVEGWLVEVEVDAVFDEESEPES